MGSPAGNSTSDSALPRAGGIAGSAIGPGGASENRGVTSGGSTGRAGSGCATGSTRAGGRSTLSSSSSNGLVGLCGVCPRSATAASSSWTRCCNAATVCRSGTTTLAIRFSVSARRFASSRAAACHWPGAAIVPGALPGPGDGLGGAVAWPVGADGAATAAGGGAFGGPLLDCSIIELSQAPRLSPAACAAAFAASRAAGSTPFTLHGAPGFMRRLTFAESALNVAADSGAVKL